MITKDDPLFHIALQQASSNWDLNLANQAKRTQEQVIELAELIATQSKETATLLEQKNSEVCLLNKQVMAFKSQLAAVEKAHKMETATLQQKMAVQGELLKIKERELYAQKTPSDTATSGQENLRKPQVQGPTTLSSLKALNAQLQSLHHKTDALLLKDYHTAIREVDQYPDRFGSLKSMPRDTFCRLAQVLEDTLTGQAFPFSAVNGGASRDYSAATVVKMLKKSTPHALMGYLAGYAVESLELTPPPNLCGEELPNFELFWPGFKGYLTLRRECTPYGYDREGKMLTKVAAVAQNALTFINHIDGALFEKLHFKYRQAVITLMELERHAFEETSREHFDSVCQEVKNDFEKVLKAIPPVATYHDIWKSKMDEFIETLVKHFQMRRDKGAGFTVDIAVPKSDMVKSIEKIMLFPLALHGPNICHQYVKRNVPLAIDKCEGDIVGPLPAEYFLAERLGLGKIRATYQESGFVPRDWACYSNNNVKFSGGTSFITSTNKETKLNTWATAGTCTDPIGTYNGTTGNWHYKLPEASPFLLRSAWANQSPIQCQTAAVSEGELKGVDAAIDKTLMDLRQRAVSKLYDGSALATLFQKALKELRSLELLTAHFSCLSGISLEDRKSILGEAGEELINSKTIKYFHKKIPGLEMHCSPFSPNEYLLWEVGNVFAEICTAREKTPAPNALLTGIEELNRLKIVPARYSGKYY